MSAYNDIATRRVERISALSDGLVAIAMTIIVLEIHVPDSSSVHTNADLLAALGGIVPQLIVYGLSFLTLGIFWGGQQTQLNLFASADRDLTWIHLAFLAAVAMMPFSTQLLGEFEDLQVALLIYWFNILVLGILLYASWAYATRAHLLKPEVTADTGSAIRRRIVVAQVLYAIGAALCVFSTQLSIAFIVVIQLNFAIAPRFGRLYRL